MRVNYLTTKPVGKCDVCGINLWAEHANGPAPTTFPCVLKGCKFQQAAKVIQFPRSSVGSSLLQITVN